MEDEEAPPPQLPSAADGGDGGADGGGKRGGGGPRGGGGERGERGEGASICICTTEHFFGSAAAEAPVGAAPRFLFALPARATRDA